MLSLLVFTLSVSILCIGSGIRMAITSAVGVSAILAFFLLSLHYAYRDRDIFQPISVINIVLLFIFVMRPAQLVISGSVHSFLFFRLYGFVYGAGELVDLPFDVALMLGAIGMGSVNTAYWFARARAGNPRLVFRYVAIAAQERKRVRSFINVYIAFALVIWTYYIYRAVAGLPHSTVDILWIYIFCVVVMLQQLMDTRLEVRNYWILILSILSFFLLATRQYIVNLLLCTVVPYIYIRGGKVNLRTILLGFVIIFVVVWYGAIRGGTALTVSTVFERLVGEFSMFDALVLALKHKATFGEPYYLGYNYLSLFNYIIPGVDIEFFDFMHTRVLFGGYVGGGTPTSLVGSLYLNFSYVGVVVGCGLLGLFVARKYNKYALMRSNLSIAYYAMLVTFTYDILRVGDISRELINYFILFGCFEVGRKLVQQKRPGSRRVQQAL